MKAIPLLAFVAVISAHAAEPGLVDPKLVASGKMDIRPDYPAAAQAQRLTGKGIFVLHISEANGHVVSVQVQKSTGHKILDDAAVTKFSNLRFKPNTLSTVTIPIEFTLPANIAKTRAYPSALRFEGNQNAFPNRNPSMGRKQ